VNAKAVVFDCDGVLIDSEDLAWEAWAIALQRYGQLPTPADKSLLLGRTASDIYAHFGARLHLPDQVTFGRELNRAIRSLFQERLRVFSDGVALVEEARSRGMRLAIASSSDERRLRMSLDLAGLTESFEVVVAGNEVTNGKPAPDLYLEAARRLGVRPEQCVAVEDSGVGVAAASTAGMRVLVVLRAHTDRERLNGADVVVDELNAAGLDEVLALFSSESRSTH
jgi:HAD superfamily hydrolase (TIGR01509 family)